PEFMVSHCKRTYWFSRMLALQWRIAFDDEILFVGSILHDIALMQAFDKRLPSDHCFTLPSARCARDVVQHAGGWSEERIRRVMEVITFNPNPRVDPKDGGVEAHLVNAGVLVDATGLRLWEIHPSDVARVLDKHPRLDMKRLIVEDFDREVDCHPGCRFAFAKRWLFFTLLVKMAPFEG
ncbi:MAG: hypothetical protein OK454_08665, partial [Thaumarchaeota archaeon]|nr:hypothetical protein [Nitrososphaerota archaeon]